jgi:hypothetical protein
MIKQRRMIKMKIIKNSKKFGTAVAFAAAFFVGAVPMTVSAHTGPEAECICDTRCTKDNVNESCPVCREDIRNKIKDKSIWIMRPSNNDNAPTVLKAGDFECSRDAEGRQLILNMSGRLDSLSSSDFQTYYDKCDLCIKVTLNGIHYQGICLMA